MMLQFSKRPALENWLPYGSVLAAALAIFFDIGFFSGIDINYFTLFSIQEHLLSALVTLPIAVLLIMMCAALYILIEIGSVKHIRRMAASAIPSNVRIRVRPLFWAMFALLISIAFNLSMNDSLSYAPLSMIFALWLFITWEKFINHKIASYYLPVSLSLFSLFSFWT